MAETISVAGTDFVANATPDPFDERDLVYQPRLTMLPSTFDSRDDVNKLEYIYKQSGQSCTGYTLAAVVNIVRILSKRKELIAKGQPASTLQALPLVSPHMLYYFGRRYDEFSGEEDLGSSLRGVLKGWFHESVCHEDEWLDEHGAPKTGVPTYDEQLRGNPLGAYYRVNPRRLDDMQSAISELGAIAASSSVHAGWSAIKPEKDAAGKPSYIIRQRKNQPARMGHAYALVGYNEVGFLVQNSWGKEWGKNGFATLPYEEWLENAFDAWAARPGVPSTPFGAKLSRRSIDKGGEFGGRVWLSGWDPEVEKYVVNLGNNGVLSRNGFPSSPVQLDRVVTEIAEQHSRWRTEGETKQDVVLYAHGGLVSESSGLAIAQRLRDELWEKKKIAAVTFAWESGATEVLNNIVEDWLKPKPFGIDLFDDALDAALERFVRKALRGFWSEMKENARSASLPMVSGKPDDVQPGATLFAGKLAKYVADEKQAGRTVNVHLVGHSAGAILLTALIDRLDEHQVPVKTVSLMAPAIRVDDFAAAYRHRLGSSVGRMALFALTDKREKDDVCNFGGVTAYRKSLLYLVARAFERATGTDTVPIVGMAKYFEEKVGGQRLDDFIRANGTIALAGVSRASNPPGFHTDAKSHGGFDEDGPTRESIAAFVKS